jgi:hypothetical protein
MLTRKNIKERALLQIAETYFGWNTNNAIKMSDETANAIRRALEAAYARWKGQSSKWHAR